MFYDFIQKVRTKLKGYKTIIFNSMIGVPGALIYLYQEFASSGLDISQFVPVKYAAATVAVIAVIGIILRLTTAGPLGSKAGLDNQPEDPTASLKEPM